MTSKNQFVVNYKVINKIGEGSFSEVLKCQDRKTASFFAAKVLRKTFNMSEEVLDCAEVVALRKILPHPNILNPLEYYYDDSCGRLILIFDLMDMSLYDLMKIKKRGFPEHKARFYLHEVLKGLYHLHKMGLFHRDVKPENILINLPKSHSTIQYSFQHERVKLADLGSIRGVYSKPPYTEYISTRWYRAPECLLTKGYYGPKMDIWAAGCVFYELVTLTPLFAGSNEIDQLAKIHAILGTPPLRILNKFTHKSQNFQNFPKQRGKGLNAVLENLSENAKNVLRLMLEYDPMRRVTLKRLLEHSYFGSLSRINMRLSDKMSAPIGTKRKQQSSEEFIKDSRNRTIKSFSLCMRSVPKKIKVNSS